MVLDYYGAVRCYVDEEYNSRWIGNHWNNWLGFLLFFIGSILGIFNYFYFLN